MDLAAACGICPTTIDPAQLMCGATASVRRPDHAPVLNRSAAYLKEFPMPQTSSLLVMVSVGAVAVVLLLGLLNMVRGGSANLSQKLMRWRVGLQFLAIIVIMGVLWARS